MELHVIVIAEGDGRPPTDAVVKVEVRDVSLADVPAPVAGSAVGRVGDTSTAPGAEGGALLARVTCRIDEPPPMGAVWVHVDADGDGRVSVGDWITKESYPIGPGDAGDVTVRVRRV